MFRALSRCPLPYSPASRTSSTRAFCWFISSVASSVETAPPPTRRRTGQSSMPPLKSAVATSRMLSLRNLKRLTSVISEFRRIPAKHFAHRCDELKRALIAHRIVHAVGVSPPAEDVLLAQDGEVLRNVALRGADGLDDILHAHFLLAEHAQDFQPQGMRDRLHRAGRLLDLFLASDQLEDVLGLALHAFHSNLSYDVV